MRTTRIPAIVILGIAIVLLSGLALIADEPGTLTGSWKLSREKSDRPDRPEMRGGGPGGRGGSMGGSSARGMGGPRGSRGAPGHGNGPSGRGPQVPMDSFYLDQRDDSIRIMLNEDRSREIFTDGRTFPTYGFGGEEVEMSASWEDGKLVVHETSPRGMKITEIWELSETGDELIVTRTMTWPDGSEGRAMRRVYDAVQ